MAGQYLIIDLSQEPPVLVAVDDAVPAAILAKLTEIKELIMTQGSAEQAQLDNLATAMSAVGDHVSAASAHISSAAGDLQSWMAANQHQPLDFTGVQAAMDKIQTADSSLSAADATMSAVVPQAPDQPLDTPVPDPGPAPEAPAPPPDATAADPSLGGSDPSATGGGVSGTDEAFT